MNKILKKKKIDLFLFSVITSSAFLYVVIIYNVLSTLNFQ